MLEHMFTTLIVDIHMYILENTHSYPFLARYMLFSYIVARELDNFIFISTIENVNTYASSLTEAHTGC